MGLCLGAYSSRQGKDTTIEMANGIYERKGRNGVTYYIRYQYDGTDIKERVGRKSRGFTKEVAKDALKARLGEIAQGRFNLEKTRKPVPFSRLVERYREYGASTKRAWAEEKYRLEPFAKLFGKTPLSQITTWQLEKWKAERRKKVKPGTVNRELTVIKHMFRKAIEWGMTTTNPATAVKRFPINDQRTRFLTEAEIQKILLACEREITSPWLLPLVTLALNTGMRQGELLSLQWDSVNLERSLITVKQSKTLRLKTIAMNEPAQETVAWLQENRYGDLLFMWPWGQALGRTTVHDAFKRACLEAAITDFRFHDLRHTFASHLVMAGVDLVTVKDLMGHVGINMTVRYSHLVPEHKAQAVAKLGSRFARLKSDAKSQSSVVSPELKEAIGISNLEQTRNVFLVRKGRGLKIVNGLEGLDVARDRIELPTRGFSVLCSTD
jgi:site-specific recombinase XerD